MSFVDPENVSEIFEKIRNLPTLGDIRILIEEIFPNWIITSTNRFSDDYSHLNRNWETYCSSLQTSPKHIIIVEDLVYDKNHRVIQAFTELATKSGFCIRKKEDYGLCSSCCKCIPTRAMYDKFVEKNIPVPERWNGRCSNC